MHQNTKKKEGNKEQRKPKIDQPLALELYRQGAKDQSELAEMFQVTKAAINQLIKWELSKREQEEAKQRYKVNKF